MGREKEYDPPEVGTILPLRSKFAENVKLDLVKKVALALENMGLISESMKPVGYSEPLRIRTNDYLNRYPVRKQTGHWIDGGKQLAVFHPDTFLPFFLNNSGSGICRMCNGKRSVREIIERLRKRHSVSKEILVEDVMRFLLLLDELDLIEFRE